MSLQLFVAWTVVTIYLVVATVVAGLFALLFWLCQKDSNPASQSAVRYVEDTADDIGYSVWGMAVLLGLSWPHLLIKSSRKDS
jgi:hypothetical protein